MHTLYFLQGAFKQNADHTYKTVSQAQDYAENMVLRVMPKGDPAMPWLDPIRLLNGVHVTGAARTDDTLPTGLTLYPPRYGSGHALKNQSSP
jgi:hypothetical protein